MRSNLRAGLFACVGLAFFGYWLASDPSDDAAQTEWRVVVPFSGALLLLAFALLVFGRMIGGTWARGLSLSAGCGLAAGSISNVVEDGLGQGWAFWGFVGALALTNLSLLGLAIAISVSGPGRRRFLALVPAGTLLAIVAFVSVGGIVMLVTWVGAAGVALLGSRIDDTPPRSVVMPP